MRKFLTKTYLSEYGWFDIAPGKTVVSYCETCKQQNQHTCTGAKKQDDGTIILRLQCNHCAMRLGL